MSKQNLKSLLSLFLLVFLLANCQQETQQSDKKITNMYSKSNITPPTADKVKKEISIHGDTRIDNYFWMRLSDEQKNAKEPDEQTEGVLNFLNSENDYTKSMLSHTEDFQKTLFEEIKGRIKQTDMSVPYKFNNYYYITRYEEGLEYPIHSRKKESLDNQEEILLDCNELAKDYSYFQVAGRSISPNNKILAYGEDTLSRRIYTLKFKDLETGKMLTDVVPNTTGSAVWANDNQTLFYTVKDEALRAYKIFKHKLGTDASEDEEIYHEADETFSIYCYKTKSQKYIVIGSYHTLTNEFQILDANTPDKKFQVFEPRDKKGKLEYSISHYDDKWYVLTNLDAQNFRLMEAPSGATTKSNWKEVIAHREDVLLSDMDIFKDYLVLAERIKGIRNIRVMPWGGKDHYINFGEDAYVAYASTNPEFDTEVLRVSFSSMTTPSTTFDYNMKTKELHQLKQQEVIGDFDSKNYQSERVFAKATDGTSVPVSIVYRKGIKKDGNNPLLLYAYGSYGASMEPYFSSVRLSLLDRGFVYAIAHIRGGQEMGRQWYEDGKMMKKKNTFTDFIDCADFLIEQKYTNSNKLFAMGGSAGGLLMGAVVNMRPELWKGVVAAVPFVDVVSTMLDETIPLTTGEFDEWGNPKNKEHYDYIKSYSPYDNVEKKDYPAMLVTTGLHDSQVQYWEPAKWVAKLRELKTDKNPLLLHTNMKAGHGGASGRFERFKITALEYAFLLDLVESELKG